MPSKLALSLALLAATAIAQPKYEDILKNLKFRSIGPATMGGRMDDFAVVESDPRIIYAGTAAGGLFKTINGGVTWQAVFENEPNPSIGDVTLAPSNPSIVYVGTGEANNRQSSSWGDGVYKSMDGGATWKHLGLDATHHIGRIVVHPTDPDTVYVAALGDLWGPNKERGVFMSKDGGATWNQTLIIDADTGVSDIAIDPQSPNILYAAAYERRRTSFGYNGGGPGGGIYRSTDGGLHWAKLATGGAGHLPAGDYGRCAVDIYRKNSNIVYALVEHATAGGLYRSEDKGLTWTRQSDTNPRPSYFSQIRIDPNSDLKLWMGGVNIYMSEDAGKTWSQDRFRDVHSDNHGIWIDPNNSDHLLSGNDGGIWETLDSGRNWRHIDNIALGQFYEVAYDFQKPYHICGGLQDNYSWCGPSSTAQTAGIGNSDWITVQGGDGFYNRIDPQEPNIIYTESQDGSLSRRDLKTSESKSIRPEEPNDQSPRYRFQWNSPLLISAHDHNTIYYGGNHLFKSTDRGDTWTVLGEDLTTNARRDEMSILGRKIDKNSGVLSRDDGVADWPCITSIAESPVKAGVLWVGTDDGNVQMSRDDGKMWTNVVSHIMGVPKMGYVSRIEPSHTEAGTAYVTFDNHRSADYAIYIFKTTNYGDSFLKLNGGIPPEAGTVHVIREDPVNPNLLFAGTEFGIFVTFDKGANWHRMKNGLPTVPVFDIQIHPREHDLILATHGRSIWIMDNISALEKWDDKVLSSDVKMFGGGRPGIEWKMANYRGFEGQSNFFAANAPNGVILDYWLKAGGPVQVKVTDKDGKQVRQINVPRAEAGALNRTVWDMRADPPVLPPAGGGRGGRGGRGGGAAAETPAPARVGQGAEGGAGLNAELNTEFGAEAGAAGARGGGGGGGGGRGGFGGGAPVDPGEYTVTVTSAGKSDTMTVTVEEDPRVEMSPDDRAKRRKAIDTLTSLIRAADEPTRKAIGLTAALTSLTGSWTGPNAVPVPEAAKKAVEDMEAKVKAAAATFTTPVPAGGRGGGGGGAGARADFVPPPVTQKLTRLMGMIGNYSGPPTSRQLEEIEEASAELQKGTATINALWEEVPKLNQTLTDAGVAYFKVTLPATVPPGRGRGGN
jgi:photosystem II stability/assembly factor-like uncharacterized protein